MKTKIYIIILSFTLTCFSQENTSVSFNVTANVINEIQVITIADIDAGIILPGEEEKVISPINDGGAGILQLEGQENSSVQISYSQQVTMTNLLSDIPLVVNYLLSGGVENNQSISEAFTANPVNVTLNAEGVYHIWIGCRFSLSDLAPGQYDGDFILEVNYN